MLLGPSWTYPPEYVSPLIKRAESFGNSAPHYSRDSHVRYYIPQTTKFRPLGPSPPESAKYDGLQQSRSGPNQL